MDELSPNTLTKTIFVYDKDDVRRRDILNYFSQKGNYRVLCLDFLVQTKKKANEIKPIAILCSPHEEHVSILKTMTVLAREWETRKIPFYLYDTELTENQKQIYIKHGIRNFFHPSASIQDIFRGVQSGASYTRFVHKSELIIKEDTLPSSSQYCYIEVLAAGLSDLRSLLGQLKDQKLNIEWSDVCLDLNKVDQFDTETVTMIRAFHQRTSSEGIDLNLIIHPTLYVKHFKSLGIVSFPSLPEFITKSDQQVSVEGGAVDLSDLDDLPSSTEIDEIGDLDDLDALLDSIPDV